MDGVLKHSLYNEVLISLGKRQVDKAVDAPWKYTVEVSDAMNSGPLDDRDVSVIYDATGLLLILGEPGSGKTTTLLDLARTLLESRRGRHQGTGSDRSEPLKLEEETAACGMDLGELSEKYRVPRKIARFWLQHDYLLPLLDGLDEVETALQPDCVAAINAFIEEFKPSGLVVCCRLNEYRWLPKRLKLNGAICIEPLSSEEVASISPGWIEIAALREAVDTDPVLQELAQTPLMLSIMSLASQGAGVTNWPDRRGIHPRSAESRSFASTLNRCSTERNDLSCVSKGEDHRLALVAGGKMREHSQSVFLVEGLQPSWLGTRAKRVAYGTIVALSLGLIFALISPDLHAEQRADR